jgi:lipoyl(octanoyl) transferase
MTAPLIVLDLGRRAYGEVLELQRELVRRRIAGTVADDLLILVEHEPVVTLGRGTRGTSLPLAPAELERRGLAVFEVERGGDVTYHGPGQLVGYPVLDLRRHRQDVHWYLRALEGMLIDALGTLGVAAERNPGLTGVWTRGRKIASIGIHVKQWVTLHGFALNVTTDLAAFDLIVPCGIPGVRMTSVALERGGADDPSALSERTRGAVIAALSRCFDRTPVEGALEADGTPAAGPTMPECDRGRGGDREPGETRCL